MFQVNAGTLLDFFNQLSKTPGPGGFSDSIEKVLFMHELCTLCLNDYNQKYFINERKLKVLILIFRFLWRKNHFQKKICGQFKKIAKRRIIIIWVSWSFITNDSYLLWNIFSIIIICANNTILLQHLCFQLSVDEDLISMIELKN